MLENKDFYPTPDKMIKKMVDGLNFKMIRTVLEPSAGKGNIVEYLQKEAKKSFGIMDKRRELFGCRLHRERSESPSYFKGKWHACCS